ncbi:class I SAM-dependent methyltransferase [Lihuaxuella thermophila]|uniref:Ubiquinone/menaquinone biosynthesis C-methylase UbiE n=1 Tax=Lihuaxuella thermophila TaxID=1173111 RepID=A0A1H8HKN7_9BACL|nr:class I SAM-dependent methyltransferase [Lihuaxuella thermophila]SEN56693.1 Ubiquinone/menaquinone biosynthesis C-methylase UbiE [Lihuaxuella thermophila]
MPQWYEESFGEDYVLVYKHRSRENASREVNQIIEWLGLSERDLILDLCCGTGRHTISLAGRGFRVVGLDLSKTLLTRAVSDAEGLAVPFVHGDMRKLPFMDGSFDAVVNLFTSFGYFAKDEENEQVLREIARVLRRGGRVLIDYMNREAVKEKLVPESVREEQGARILEKRQIDGDFVRKQIRVKDERGERTYQECVKMYTHEQMAAMMEKAGLIIDHTYGNFRGEPYHMLSERMILVGRVEK